MSIIVSPATPLSHQFVYGVWLVSAVFAWDALVSFGAGNALIRSLLFRHAWRITRASGALLMIVGAAVAFG